MQDEPAVAAGEQGLEFFAFDASKPPVGPAALQLGDDYYYDGPYLVFTEKYHLQRGTC